MRYGCNRGHTFCKILTSLFYFGDAALGDGCPYLPDTRVRGPAPLHTFAVCQVHLNKSDGGREKNDTNLNPVSTSVHMEQNRLLNHCMFP